MAKFNYTGTSQSGIAPDVPMLDAPTISPTSEGGLLDEQLASPTGASVNPAASQADYEAYLQMMNESSAPQQEKPTTDLPPEMDAQMRAQRLKLQQMQQERLQRQQSQRDQIGADLTMNEIDDRLSNESGIYTPRNDLEQQIYQGSYARLIESGFSQEEARIRANEELSRYRLASKNVTQATDLRVYDNYDKLKATIDFQAAEGFVQNAAIETYYAGNDIKQVSPYGDTATSFLSGTMGVDENTINFAMVNAMAATGYEISIKEELIEKGYTPEEATEEAAYDYSEADIFGQIYDTDSEWSVEDATTPEIFKRRQALALKQAVLTQANFYGNVDYDQISKVNPKILEDTAYEIAMNTGLFEEINTKINGKLTKIIRPTSDGTKFIRGAKDMSYKSLAQDPSTKQLGKRSVTPANRHTGSFPGYNPYFKSFDVIKNKGINKLKFSMKEMPTLTSYIVAAGSVPHTSSKNKIGMMGLLGVIAGGNSPLRNKAQELIALDEKRHAKLAAKKKKEGSKSANNIMHNKTLKEFNDSLEIFTNIVDGNMPEFNFVSMDPQVARIYYMNRAVEVQSNITNRNLVNGILKPQNVAKGEVRNLLSDVTKLSQDAEKYFFGGGYKGGIITDPRMRMLSHLMTGQAAIERTFDSTYGARFLRDNIERLNMDTLIEYGKVGIVLKQLISKLGDLNSSTIKGIALTNRPDPNMPDAPISSTLVSNFNLELTPEEIQTLETVFRGTDKKTIGPKMSAYISFAELLIAQKNGGIWTPNFMIDIDMNSAGRAFIANDIGYEELLKRVGALVDEFHSEMLEGPRVLFAEHATMHLNNAATAANKLMRNIESPIGEDSYIEAANNLRSLLKTIFKEDPSLIDDFGKKVLMVDDYGKYHAMHQDNAELFINKLLLNEKHAGSIQQFIDMYYGANGKDQFVLDLSDLYSLALIAPGHMFAKTLPKNMVKTLGWFGRYPNIVMPIDNITVPFGSMSTKPIMDKESLSYLQTLDANGNPITKVVPMKYKSFSNPTKPSKVKTVKAFFDVYDNEGNIVLRKGETGKLPQRASSHDVNSIGPISGQLRESLVLIKAVTDLNKQALSEGKEPLWFASVHDNLVLNGDSYLPYLTHINKTDGGAATQVFEWDMMGSFIKDYQQQMNEVLNDLIGKAKAGMVLDGSYGSEYAGLTAAAIQAASDYKRAKNDPRSTPEQIQRNKEMLDIWQTMFSGVDLMSLSFEEFSNGSVEQDVNGNVYRKYPTILIDAKDLHKQVEYKKRDKNIRSSEMQNRRQGALRAILDMMNLTESASQFVNFKSESNDNAYTRRNKHNKNRRKRSNQLMFITA